MCVCNVWKCECVVVFVHVFNEVARWGYIFSGGGGCAMLLYLVCGRTCRNMRMIWCVRAVLSILRGEMSMPCRSRLAVICLAELSHF